MATFNLIKSLLQDRGFDFGRDDYELTFDDDNNILLVIEPTHSDHSGITWEMFAQSGCVPDRWIQMSFDAVIHSMWNFSKASRAIQQTPD